MHAVKKLFIFALSVPFVKVRDSQITKASKAFIITADIPRAKHHRGDGKYTLLLNLSQSSKSLKVLTS